MSPILDGCGILSDLHAAGDLEVWPEMDFSEPLLFGRPLVILLHGMGPGRSLLDMTDPTNQELLFPYDTEWRPEEKEGRWRQRGQLGFGRV